MISVKSRYLDYRKQYTYTIRRIVNGFRFSKVVNRKIYDVYMDFIREMKYRGLATGKDLELYDRYTVLYLTELQAKQKGKAEEDRDRAVVERYENEHGTMLITFGEAMQMLGTDSRSTASDRLRMIGARAFHGKKCWYDRKIIEEAMKEGKI